MSNMDGTDQGSATGDAGQTQPGWYPDPSNGQLRWWDGSQWGQFQQAGGAPVPMAQGSGGDPKTMAMLAHLLGAFTGFVGPVIIYATSGDKDPFVKESAAEATNFHLTILIGYLISFVLMIVLIGFLTYLLLFVASVAFSIIGAMAANKGEMYRYPWSIKFLKA